MRRTLNWIIFFEVLLSTFLWAGTGTSGAQFLQLGGGGRPSALGGAFTAFGQGLESIYINPAGLANLKQREAAFTHSEFYADMTYENVALGIPVAFGSVTLSAVALLSGDIEETTLDEPQGTGETFNANDYSFNISYARKMTDKFSAGITFKYLLMNIAELQATGYAFDFGATYDIGVKNIRIGFVLSNFGPDLRYSGEKLEYETQKSTDNPNQATDVNAAYESELFQLPLTFRVGLAYDAINNENHRITILADGLNPNDQKENLAAGIEYCFNNKYFLRAGHAGVLNNGYRDGGINQRGFTFGAGAIIDFGSSNLVFDYCFEEHKYLSNISRFTFGFIF